MSEGEPEAKKLRHDFSENTRFRNFLLKVDDGELWVNRECLAESSPVFEAMFFNGGFQESQKDVEFVELPDKKLEDILELMRVLLPSGGGDPHKLTGSTILHFMCTPNKLPLALDMYNSDKF